MKHLQLPPGVVGVVVGRRSCEGSVGSHRTSAEREVVVGSVVWGEWEVHVRTEDGLLATLGVGRTGLKQTDRF